MITASFLLARQRPDSEKLSPYECASTRRGCAHSLRRALLSGRILFIIFDLEVGSCSLGGLARRYRRLRLLSMIVFLGVLTVGFAYDGRKGRSNGIMSPGSPVPPATSRTALLRAATEECRIAASSPRRFIRWSIGRAAARCGR